MASWTACVLLVFALANPLSSAHAKTLYKIVPLPAEMRWGLAIDEQGKVAALAESSSVLQLCTKAACRAVTPDLPEMAWIAMNDAHTVAGYTIADEQLWAIRKVRGREVESLLAGTALGVGPDGAAVGHTADQHAFVYTDQLLVLPSIDVFASQANAVNASHVVVGASKTRTPRMNMATQWVDGELVVLGRLPNGTISEATAINSSGVVVGYSDGGDNGTHRSVVRFDVGSVHALKLPYDHHDAEALAINDAGTIVGAGVGDENTYYGLVSEGDRMVDLNQRLKPADRTVYLITAALRINELGQILAAATERQTGRKLLVRLDPR